MHKILNIGFVNKYFVGNFKQVGAHFFALSKIVSNIPKTNCKGCLKGTRGTDNLICIDQHTLKESKARRKNIAMIWIDFKKAYDIIPQFWIVDNLKMCKISDKVIELIAEALKN